MNFNLCSWREREQIYQKKTLKQIFGAAVTIPSLILLLVHFSYATRQENFSRLVSVKANKVALNKKNTSTIVSPGENQLPFLQKLLMALSQSPESELCLTRINVVNHKTEFAGKANTAAVVPRFLSTWKAAPLFNRAEIKRLENHGKEKIRFLFQGVHES